MRITSGSVTIEKDENNMIGISIGGGAPNCPCLYIVQVCVLIANLALFNFLFSN